MCSTLCDVSWHIQQCCTTQVYALDLWASGHAHVVATQRGGGCSHSTYTLGPFVNSGVHSWIDTETVKLAVIPISTPVHTPLTILCSWKEEKGNELVREHFLYALSAEWKPNLNNTAFQIMSGVLSLTLQDILQGWSQWQLQELAQVGIESVVRFPVCVYGGGSRAEKEGK